MDSVSTKKSPKVALVCDWLTTVGGAESVLLTLHEMYPSAPIYTSKYNRKGIDWFKDADVRTGWLQIFPTCLRRFISPLRQSYFSHLDLSSYDIVISVTGAEAKSVRTSPKTRTKGTKTEQTEHRCRHLCYCHVPTQYYWAMYDDYLKNPGFGILNPLARLGLKLFVKPLRKKDYAAAQRPDQFITISHYAKDQIKKYYGREAEIIYPPLDFKKFSTGSGKRDVFSTTNQPKSQTKKQHNYVTTSRQVNWKRIDLCIKACLRTGDQLVVIGDGPEHKSLVKLADGARNIHFLEAMPQSELKQYLASADAFLFPSMEPFGLAPIEALAVGTPVIAYGKGGALDYVIPGKNGILFREQTTASLAAVLKKFNPADYSTKDIIASAAPFDKKFFKQKIQEAVDAAFKNQ